jgi:Methyltransferase domain
MDRIELIQKLINKFGFKRYLEIGVLDGYVFFQLKCKNKIAVDPEFQFDSKRKFQALKANFSNIRNKFYQVKSDDFFRDTAPSLLKDKKIDISFVDGMHEFRYVLNDVENSLQYLREDGIIVMHDCNPQSAEAGCSFADWGKRGYTGDWNGDTWKTVTYLLRNRPDLEIFTADCDYGLGVITKRKQPRENCTPETFEEINALTYEELNNNRGAYLNLKSVEYLKDFFKI